MPFDATPSDVRTLPDRRTALRNLSWLLRNPHHWPSGFKWDYWYEETCAIGLCRQVYGEEVLYIINGTGSQVVETYQIFYDRSRRIKPTDIAKSIDRYLNKRKVIHEDHRQLELDLAEPSDNFRALLSVGRITA
jgi:hypothetical protein